MLGLNDLLDEVNNMRSGVGKTVQEFRQAADGLAALKNTGHGLYEDFNGMPDKFGREVQYTTENFKKFGVVPLLGSIQRVLNEYLPAVYLIAFVLLVVGTMREFLFLETRRFMQNLLCAVLLVAVIGFLPMPSGKAFSLWSSCWWARSFTASWSPAYCCREKTKTNSL